MNLPLQHVKVVAIKKTISNIDDVTSSPTWMSNPVSDFLFEKASTKMFSVESEIFGRQPKTWGSQLTKWLDHAKEILLTDRIPLFEIIDGRKFFRDQLFLVRGSLFEITRPNSSRSNFYFWTCMTEQPPVVKMLLVKIKSVPQQTWRQNWRSNCKTIS